MLCRVVSNVTEPLDLFIEPAMTVGEVRVLIKEMVCEPGEWNVSLKFQGRTLHEDDESWSSVCRRNPHHEGKAPKIIVLVSSTQEAETRGLGVSAIRNQVDTEQERMEAKMTELAADMLAKNPELLESMLSPQTTLRRLVDENPELRQVVNNPDALKSVIMSYVDPKERRMTNRILQLQMAQLSSVPGGEQLLQRYTSGLLDDLDADLSAIGKPNVAGIDESAGRPDSTKRCNKEPLPNPWSSASSHRGPSQGNPAFPARDPRAHVEGLLPCGAPNGQNPGNVLDPNFQSVLGALMSRYGNNTNGDETQRRNDAHRWARQLEIMKDMGFSDEELCLEALRMSNGDVDVAVDFIVNRSS